MVCSRKLMNSLSSVMLRLLSLSSPTVGSSMSSAAALGTNYSKPHHHIMLLLWATFCVVSLVWIYGAFGEFCFLGLAYSSSFLVSWMPKDFILLGDKLVSVLIFLGEFVCICFSTGVIFYFFCFLLCLIFYFLWSDS